MGFPRRLAVLGLIVVLVAVLAPRLAALNQVRIETNVDAAVAKYGVSGNGVLVAILDRGLDYTNDDFRNLDGTTRIQAILDLTDDTGAASTGYGIGTLYTRAQINAALAASTPLGFRDAVGHGTTTTGIAAGNGRNSVAGKYRGVAPNATLLVVKVTSDGAPAHDGQLAEAAYYQPSRLITAIQFVKDQKVALGMPAVMLLNLGSQGGPTDGTSTLARKIDEVVGPGKSGIVFVSGPGDEGGNANRAGGNVPNGGTAAIQVQKAAAGTLSFELWYPEPDRFNVTIQTPTTTNGPYVAPATASNVGSATTGEFAYFHRGANVDFSGATSNKRQILIQINGAPGLYTITLTGASVTAGGRFDATLNPAAGVNPTYSGNKFLTFVAPGSIWDGASSLYNICPNAYVGRTSWVDIDGFNRNSTAGEGGLGQIWKGSSVGPTFDGRVGIDLSAPGQVLISSYSVTSYWATFRFNLVNDGGGKYGIASAVSAAAPIVTGVIALMLEMNPTLDAAQIKTLLHQSARADGQTGPVPNTTWGYGKLDALAALNGVCGIGPSAFCGATGGNLVQNGDFAAGLSNWQLFEEPDIVHNNAAGGVFQYHKASPTSTASGQAVIFQQTGQPVAADAALTAQFDIGNSDTVRKRVSVLLLNADFSDLSVCTFYLLPSAPLRTYRMRTHPTKAWTSASIYFYAANGGTSGGEYLLDNVSLRADPAASVTRTDCIDPVVPAANASLAPEATLLTNGNFASGNTAGWTIFGDLTSQVTAGAFEFLRPGTPGQPAGVILQPTNQPMVANQLLTAAFKLGNSSGVRKRVTVIMHDLDFSDLSACTFWIAPGQTLQPYTMRAYTTKTWDNATLSIYAATVGGDQWIRLDDAGFYRTPSTAIQGSECVEPLSNVIIGGPPNPSAEPDGIVVPGVPAATTQGWTPDHTNAGGAASWGAVATGPGALVLTLIDAIDLRQSSGAQLSFQSWLHAARSSAAIEVSADGVNWTGLWPVPPTDGWVSMNIDLSSFAGQRVFVRFVLRTGSGVDAVSPDWWRIASVRVDVHAPH